MIEVVRALPPNFDRIIAALPLAKSKRGVLFTYGARVYNPDGVALTPWLREHEATHVEQQRAFGAEVWWDRYLADIKFRLEQELEAVIAEYREFCRASPSPNRTQRAAFLDSIASRLSGHLYGYMARKKDVRRALKQRV